MDRDYRPIACCSVVYKAATRIMDARLAQYIPRLIAPNQAAFVEGMGIVNNSLLAQEVVREYSRRTLSPGCAIKVDLQKVFDSLDWGFVLKILEAVGIPERCQAGDPLSPYLFVIAMNVLTYLLNMTVSQKGFQFHPKCRKGTLDSILGVKSVLEVFYEQSGLKLNAFKYELFTSGVSVAQKFLMHEVTGFRLGELPVRYMGVILVTRKLTERDFVVLVEKRIGQLCSSSSGKVGMCLLKMLESVERVFVVLNLKGLGAKNPRYWNKTFIIPFSSVLTLGRSLLS
ncbi:uncharacterized protein LOC120194245 [Hibiscus syriacus]|uniref:uncharacterized protein LOC120194245 n=1 Tax=Hibiscus syriacus TaxID=106335 RepID=UPI0019221A40|nr:uncharacterized protein LOC120194245 [Hibiscus syriacus]